MDLVFAGLVRRLGKENVIDWPPRDKFRQGLPKLVGDHERDYGAERRSLSYVAGCEDMPRRDRVDVSRMLSAGEIGYVFLDETVESSDIYWNLIGSTVVSGVTLPIPPPWRAVVVAGHDRFRGNPIDVRDRYSNPIMFIDDWKPEYDRVPDAHLINLSCNFDHLWSGDRTGLADKQYDICFIGYNSHPARKLVIDQVRHMWGHLNNCIIFEERQDQFDRFVRHDEMFKLMARSKICLNLPGASTGGRALRYYETPYVGSFMLSQKFGAKLLDPFVHGVHCMYFDSVADLHGIIYDMLEDETSRETMAEQGHRHCMKRHTVDARMDYIFGVLNG